QSKLLSVGQGIVLSNHSRTARTLLVCSPCTAGCGRNVAGTRCSNPKRRGKFAGTCIEWATGALRTRNSSRIYSPLPLVWGESASNSHRADSRRGADRRDKWSAFLVSRSPLQRRRAGNLRIPGTDLSGRVRARNYTLG